MYERTCACRVVCRVSCVVCRVVSFWVTHFSGQTNETGAHGAVVWAAEGLRLGVVLQGQPHPPQARYTHPQIHRISAHTHPCACACVCVCACVDTDGGRWAPNRVRVGGRRGDPELPPVRGGLHDPAPAPSVPLLRAGLLRDLQRGGRQEDRHVPLQARTQLPALQEAEAGRRVRFPSTRTRTRATRHDTTRAAFAQFSAGEEDYRKESQESLDLLRKWREEQRQKATTTAVGSVHTLSLWPSRGCALTCVLVWGVCRGGCRARQRDALLSPRAGSLAGNTREKKEAFEGGGGGGGSAISESNRAWKTALNRNKGFRGYPLVPTSLPSLDVLLICAIRHATRHDTRRDHGMLLDRRAIASSAPASCGARSAEQEGDST
jgi:hypothetical protein